MQYNVRIWLRKKLSEYLDLIVIFGLSFCGISDEFRGAVVCSCLDSDELKCVWQPKQEGVVFTLPKYGQKSAISISSMTWYHRKYVRTDKTSNWLIPNLATVFQMKYLECKTHQPLVCFPAGPPSKSKGIWKVCLFSWEESPKNRRNPQSKGEPTLNSTHRWHRARELNSGHIGERRIRIEYVHDSASMSAPRTDACLPLCIHIVCWMDHPNK